ncbi:MAG: prolyl oligopeptidase family serine peptidase [Candidatus Heimdallarchaeota archaeon]|nr:prolyl oligopeptidase family serine peptidase [Candidatus Heimdallarchaeota archaeon]
MNRQGKNTYQPTIKDMIFLEKPLEVKVSPNGQKIAYSVQKTNWKENCYQKVCYIYDQKKEQKFQLTRTGSVNQFEWIDDDSLAVLGTLQSKNNSEPQIWLFDHLIGEGWQVTDHEEGVKSFKPFANGLLFLTDNPEKKKKKRKKEFGSFIHFEKEESSSAIYYVNLQEMQYYLERLKTAGKKGAKKLIEPVIELTKNFQESRAITEFFASPKGDTVYLNCRRREDLVYVFETSCYKLTIDPDFALDQYLEQEETKKTDENSTKDGKNDDKKPEDYSYLNEWIQLQLPKAATIIDIAPDGNKLVIAHKERDIMMYTQTDLWIVDLEKITNLQEEKLEEHLVNITRELDQEPFYVQWIPQGIVVSFVDHQIAKLVQINQTGEITPINLNGLYLYHHYHLSKKGHLAFIGTNSEKFVEVYFTEQPINNKKIKIQRITNFNSQLENWSLGQVEVIKWPSKDGTTIEGVLRKPTNFDPKKKYPLVFVVHGGPASVSFNYLLEMVDLFFYPTVQFSNQELLVLKPNYRGSIGRGQAFKELNKENLGIGDLWDIEAAIDYLDKEGIIDPTKIGCMGWSQGGYISAFVSMHSDRFAAVSVGAGLGDWYTYHITNDIPQFTTHYLSESPFANRDLYQKTAPLSKIQQAKTPTLIQHGEKDQRVPLACAKEIYRGLQAMDVPVELFIFKGMGHPITKPKENHAVMHQNLNWFNHFLLGKELNFVENEDD